MDKIQKIEAAVETYINDQLENTTNTELLMAVQLNRQHIVNIGVSIKATQYDIQRGGGFVQYVVDNNLGGAIGHADQVMLKVLPLMVMIRDWCHPNI